ncbi:acyl-CoA dehydrogenase family protein [Labedaea rhizosphaerae]|uniref:Alkylation response protein AidB-like acyl-CoA dehydrogenase n=1 Tax=Labedaea rhizosphaerae TaxID=598644 RepID=A0A4R6S8D5_LABRH|nr:acyl-CoA dehydrogenase family protein [Labedaea rhizosphaerae]TDP95116.1 alkylation response protein AidB-like acyl-CoA dehydrogenase [Labedaea rhizosphaerae]
MSATLIYSEVEEDLRASVRDLLADHASPAAVLARCESDQPYDLELWRLLGEMGATTLHVPEELGGQGASMRETAVVLEELGRSVAPVPFLGSAVLASAVFTVLGEPVPSETATLVVPFSSWQPVFSSGPVRSVADATVASLFIVPVSTPDGPELHLASSATVTPVTSLDLTRPVADVTVSESTVLARGADASNALRVALLTGAGLLASEQVGIAERCLFDTVAYLRERHQFGRAVGSFQALKHRLADLYQELVTARAAARYAADALATGEDVEIAVAVAAAHCSDVAVHAAEEAVQLHGGIGMTWEHPAHLFLKRAKADQLALGTPDRHRAALAELVDLRL